MNDQSIYAFILCWFLLQTALGFWIGHRFYSWRVKRLLARIELLKMELGWRGR